ncbi:MAG: prenyltransferase/squalene oxidase repeat-containing protein [bacterium]
MKTKHSLFLLLVLLVVPAVAQTTRAPAAAAVVRPETARIEGATAGGLRWLADHQITNGASAGAWAVNSANYRPAIASLVGLAFLSNGHLPGTNTPYARVVAGALKHVTSTMASDGYVGQGDQSGMYIHAISTLFVLSCYGMQSDEALDPELASWCRRSLDVILRAQQTQKSFTERGGWRYEPYGEQSDVSVTCWQLLVLHAARQAGFEVEMPVYNAALSYLNRAYVPVKAEKEKGAPAGGYLYRPGFTQDPERPATALVLFIQSLFDAGNNQRTQAALEFLRRYPLTWDGSQYNGYFYFSGFYMMQGMFQIGGAEWNSFGPRMANLLLDHQNGDGSWPYPPNSLREDMQTTGPAYPVAMSVLMLSLDKQYLPMYQRQRRIYENSALIVTTSEPEAKTSSPPPPPPPIPPPPGPAKIPDPLVPDVPAPVGIEPAQPTPVVPEPVEEPEEGVIQRPIGYRLGG